MKKNTLSIVILTALIAVSSPIQAELSATVGLYSDYIFRGVSQTDEDPALQASLDWANENGWYSGLWASNVDFNDDADVEVDFYGGYANSLDNGLEYDLQLVYYTYPGSDDESDYPELLFNFNYAVFNFLTGYTWDNFDTGRDALYLQGGFDVPMSNDYGIHGFIGWSDYDDPVRQFGVVSPDSYINWNIGISKSWNGFDMNLDYFDTDSDAEPLFGQDTTDSRIVFSISRTFGLLE